MRRPPSSSILGLCLVAAASGALAAEPSPAVPALEFPRIASYGGVARIPDAGEMPRPGGKIVFDTTAAAAAGKPNRGLDSAARLVNIYALEGMDSARPRIAVILHAGATAAALATDATGAENPERRLVDALLAEGVEVWVCGQSVIRTGHSLDEIMPGIRVAFSAMTFNANRQADGWSPLGVH